MKKLTKPIILAQNRSKGSFVAGCPANKDCTSGSNGGRVCKSCERSA